MNLPLSVFSLCFFFFDCVQRLLYEMSRLLWVTRFTITQTFRLGHDSYCSINVCMYVHDNGGRRNLYRVHIAVDPSVQLPKHSLNIFDTARAQAPHLSFSTPCCLVVSSILMNKCNIHMYARIHICTCPLYSGHAICCHSLCFATFFNSSSIHYVHGLYIV